MRDSQTHYCSCGIGIYTATASSDDYVHCVWRRSIRTHRNDLSTSFLIYYGGFVLHYHLYYSKKCKVYCQIIPWILIIAIGWNQALITSRIFYTENIVFNQDVLTAQAIKSRIDKLGLGERPDEPLVFVGNHVAKCNPDCYSANQLGLTGRSMLEIGFSTEHGTGIKKQFMADILGVYYNSATSQQIEQSERLAESMPHWPDPGSVAEKDGIVIVNF